MADKRLDRLRRVTDLFVRGTTLYLGDDEDDSPILVWVAKPNQFERSEARKDGQFGRQRKLMMLTEDSDEVQAVRHEAHTLTDEQLIDANLVPRRMEVLGLARDDVMSNPDWRDRMELLERWDELSRDGIQLEDAENERYSQVSQEYLSAVDEAMQRRAADIRAELEDKDRHELIDAYVESYRQAEGLESFQVEAQITELYYALRDCVATDKRGEDWDHTKCTHPRLYPTRADIRALPDDMLSRARNALRSIQMSDREAGNSVAPASSSASSERPKQQADSTPSTPAGT